MLKLIKEYEDIADKIKIEFQKYMWDESYPFFGYWIGGSIGAIGEICDFGEGNYFANLQHMVEVLKNQYNPQVVEAHYEYSTHYSGEEGEYGINLKNFVKLYNGQDVENFAEIYHEKRDKERSYWNSPKGKEQERKQKEELKEKFINSIEYFQDKGKGNLF